MPRRSLRLSWIDLLVVAATSVTFAAVFYSKDHHHAPMRPTEAAIQAMADELGVTADEFHRAAEQVPPLPHGIRPSQEQRAEHRRAFAAALSVPPDRLDAVLRKYGPPPPPRL
jgi:hypothetical protein